MPDQRDFFLSFVDADLDVATALNEALVAEGYTTWFNPLRNPSSAMSKEEMKAAIEASERMIAICSKHYIGSANTAYRVEWNSEFWHDATNNENLIIVRVDAMPFPPRLYHKEAVDLALMSPQRAAKEFMQYLRDQEHIHPLTQQQDTDRKPIFISYRRSDEPFAATMLYDKLSDAFGADRIFKDVDSFEPGDDFPIKLAHFVESSDILLAVIGPDWLAAEDELGRRIDNPLDWVRIEIATALEQEKRVVPVLVNDAQMPGHDDLPDNLKRLVHKHAFSISAARAAPETQALIKWITRALEQADRERADAALKAEAEAARRAEERAARAREEAFKETQSVAENANISSAQVAAMRAIQNWEHIKPRKNIAEHRDHLARFPNDETERFVRAALDELVWEATDASSVDALETYLGEFENGLFAQEAKRDLAELRRAQSDAAETQQQRLREQAAWSDVAASDDPKSLRAFIADFPNGTYVPDAKKRLKDLGSSSRRGLLVGGVAGVICTGLTAWQVQPGQFLWRQFSDRILQVLNGHTGPVRSAVFSPDGNSVLSGSDDGTVRLWDVASGETRHVLEGHLGAVLTVAFAADGQTALSGGWDKTLRLWDMNTGRVIRVVSGHEDVVRAGAFGPRGNTLVSCADDGTVRLWNSASGSVMRVMEGHDGWVASLDFAPINFEALSGGGDGTLRHWDVGTGRVIRVWRGHSNAVTSVAFAPDGATALSGSFDETLRLWNVDGGRTIRVMSGHNDAITSVAFAPDGQTALSGSFDNSVRLWDVATGDTRHILDGHDAWVRSVAFAPNGKWAVWASADWSVRIWDLRGL